MIQFLFREEFAHTGIHSNEKSRIGSSPANREVSKIPATNWWLQSAFLSDPSSGFRGSPGSVKGNFYRSQTKFRLDFLFKSKSTNRHQFGSRIPVPSNPVFREAHEIFCMHRKWGQVMVILNCLGFWSFALNKLAIPMTIYCTLKLTAGRKIPVEVFDWFITQSPVNISGTIKVLLFVSTKAVFRWKPTSFCDFFRFNFLHQFA